MKKVLVITGSTASGKSDYGIDLAKELNGEIISCDSVQVYKKLDIGSAKIKDTQNIVHHMIDIFEPDESMNVMTFQQMARKHIDEITERDKLPICVGGTGFYIKSLLFDYQFQPETITADFSMLSNQQLHDYLKEVDPDQAQKIHVNNRQRLLRIAQQMSATKKTRTEIIQEQKNEMLYDGKIFYLTYERTLLHQRIKERVDQMFDEGLLEEVYHLSKGGTDFSLQALSSIGYKEFEDYFNKKKSLSEVKEQIVIHTRQFSKRQMTWFKHQLPGRIVDRNNPEDLEMMRKEILEWVNLNGHD